MSTLQQINSLLQQRFAELPSDSILGGQTGAAIISAFVSEGEIPGDFLTPLNGLLELGHADISIEVWKLWLVATLLENDLIDLPDGYPFDRLVREAISQSRAYCRCSPVKLTPCTQLYPFGLVSLKALKLLDGIPFYSLIEWIVLFMRDCEYFLTRSVPHIHDNTTLKASVLHSVFRFMQLAEAQKIYPWKAAQLQQVIKQMRYDRAGSLPTDNYILDYLTGSAAAKRHWTDKELAYLGTIAFIYDIPALFAGEFHPLSLDEIGIDDLVGIGLGLLSNTINGIEL